MECSSLRESQDADWVGERLPDGLVLSLLLVGQSFVAFKARVSKKTSFCYGMIGS